MSETKFHNYLYLLLWEYLMLKKFTKDLLKFL